MRRPKTRERFWPLGLTLFVALLAIDLYTKYTIAALYALGETQRFLPWFSFTYVLNTGGVWSILPDANALFIWLSIIAFGALLYYHDTFKTTMEKTALVLILVGLWGNLINRVTHGAVIDFISVGWWPVFNIADSAINVGIALYLLEQLRTRPDRKAARDARSS